VGPNRLQFACDAVLPTADPVDFLKFHLNIIYLFVSDHNVQRWLWSLPPSPLFNEYRGSFPGVKRPGREDGRLPVSSA
jgi:hypothetical protein